MCSRGLQGVGDAKRSSYLFVQCDNDKEGCQAAEGFSSESSESSSVFQVSDRQNISAAGMQLY